MPKRKEREERRREGWRMQEGRKKFRCGNPGDEKENERKGKKEEKNRLPKCHRDFIVYTFHIIKKSLSR